MRAALAIGAVMLALAGCASDKSAEGRRFTGLYGGISGGTGR